MFANDSGKWIMLRNIDLIHDNRLHDAMDILYRDVNAPSIRHVIKKELTIVNISIYLVLKYTLLVVIEDPNDTASVLSNRLRLSIPLNRPH